MVVTVDAKSLGIGFSLQWVVERQNSKEKCGISTLRKAKFMEKPVSLSLDAQNAAG